MCFSAEMSFGIASLGIGAGVYVQSKGGSLRLCIPAYFFSSMEALQGFQYFWINECGNPTNQTLTALGWAHICFQPYFANMFISWFIKDKKMGDLYWSFVSKLCLVTGFFLLSRLYVPDGKLCAIGSEVLCAERLCAYSGSFHIAWEIPLRAATYMTPSQYAHFFMLFVPGLMAGCWKLTLWVFVSGVVLPVLFVSDMNEAPVIWCFFSTTQGLIILRAFQLQKRKEGVMLGLGMKEA